MEQPDTLQVQKRSPDIHSSRSSIREALKPRRRRDALGIGRSNTQIDAQAQAPLSMRETYATVCSSRNQIADLAGGASCTVPCFVLPSNSRSSFLLVTPPLFEIDISYLIHHPLHVEIRLTTIRFYSDGFPHLVRRFLRQPSSASVREVDHCSSLSDHTGPGSR